MKDRDNDEHGISSARMTGEYFRENINNQYGIELNEIEIIQAAIEMSKGISISLFLFPLFSILYLCLILCNNFILLLDI